jgi:hypothetical protein
MCPQTARRVRSGNRRLEQAFDKGAVRRGQGMELGSVRTIEANGHVCTLSASHSVCHYFSNYGSPFRGNMCIAPLRAMFRRNPCWKVAASVTILDVTVHIEVQCLITD